MSEHFQEARERIDNQLTRILDTLRKAGKKGCTSVQLNKIASRLGSRMTNLYMKGYKISVTHLGDGVYNYVLEKEPTYEKPIYYEEDYLSAEEILLKEIRNKFNGKVTMEELSSLLSETNLTISRRKGYFKRCWLDGGPGR